MRPGARSWRLWGSGLVLLGPRRGTRAAAREGSGQLGLHRSGLWTWLLIWLISYWIGATWGFKLLLKNYFILSLFSVIYKPCLIYNNVLQILSTHTSRSGNIPVPRSGRLPTVLYRWKCRAASGMRWVLASKTGEKEWIARRMCWWRGRGLDRQVRKPRLDEGYRGKSVGEKNERWRSIENDAKVLSIEAGGNYSISSYKWFDDKVGLLECVKKKKHTCLHREKGALLGQVNGTSTHVFYLGSYRRE